MQPTGRALSQSVERKTGQDQGSGILAIYAVDDRPRFRNRGLPATWDESSKNKAARL